MHWGLDLAGARGTEVISPERAIVSAVWGDDATPPFVGYGPGGALLRGESGWFHLLGHLDPSDLPELGATLAEGGHVGVMSELEHTHWEVRRDPIDSPSTRQANTVDPAAWVTETRWGPIAFLVVLGWWLISRR